jgi:hypothetical protein
MMRRQDVARLIAPVFATGLLCFAVVFGQESEQRVRMKDLPAAVRNTVLEQSQGAVLKGLSKEVEHGQTFYEAEMKVNGHGKDILIDPAGAVVEIEEEVTMASLGTPVRSTIEQSAGKGRVLKVESITRNGSIEAYEAVIQKAGKKSEIKVAPDGKLMPRE